MNTIKTQHIMQKTFTKEFMQDNCGCYSLSKLNVCSFMKSDIITLQSIVDSEIPLKDKYWFVCKKLATKEQNQQIAIDVATIVLPIYERRYPDDKRPHEAIEAAKQFIVGHIGIDELIAKRKAAAAAYAAAYAAADAADAAAADAADAAADAADAAAADAAAADAAYAAYAAAAAAYAAADADAAAIKTQLLTYLKNFINEHD